MGPRGENRPFWLSTRTTFCGPLDAYRLIPLRGRSAWRSSRGKLMGATAEMRFRGSNFEKTVIFGPKKTHFFACCVRVSGSYRDIIL